jgi:hypothetical protein
MHACACVSAAALSCLSPASATSLAHSQHMGSARAGDARGDGHEFQDDIFIISPAMLGHGHGAGAKAGSCAAAGDGEVVRGSEWALCMADRIRGLVGVVRAPAIETLRMPHTHTHTHRLTQTHRQTHTVFRAPALETLRMPCTRAHRHGHRHTHTHTHSGSGAYNRDTKNAWT